MEERLHEFMVSVLDFFHYSVLQVYFMDVVYFLVKISQLSFNFICQVQT